MEEGGRAAQHRIKEQEQCRSAVGVWSRQGGDTRTEPAVDTVRTQRRSETAS